MGTFSAIYDTPDLITSFDGGNIFRPWQTEALQDHCTTSGWMHVDQGRTLRGKQCIQGLITLTDVNEGTGGFCCIPGSHQHHDELMDSRVPVSNNDNYVKIPGDFHALQDEQVLPRCEAGDMILWDSRTFHCSTSALVLPTTQPDQLLRMVSYVCMVPADLANDDVIEKRVEMYRCNVTGTHWPHLLNYKKNPSNVVTNEVSSLSREAIALLTGSREPYNCDHNISLETSARDTYSNAVYASDVV